MCDRENKHEMKDLFVLVKLTLFLPFNLNTFM